MRLGTALKRAAFEAVSCVLHTKKDATDSPRTVNRKKAWLPLIQSIIGYTAAFCSRGIGWLIDPRFFAKAFHQAKAQLVFLGTEFRVLLKPLQGVGERCKGCITEFVAALLHRRDIPARSSQLLRKLAGVHRPFGHSVAASRWNWL